jgi:hypothetical protein
MCCTQPHDFTTQSAKSASSAVKDKNMKRGKDISRCPSVFIGGLNDQSAKSASSAVKEEREIAVYSTISFLVIVVLPVSSLSK